MVKILARESLCEREEGREGDRVRQRDTEIKDGRNWCHWEVKGRMGARWGAGSSHSSNPRRRDENL